MLRAIHERKLIRKSAWVIAFMLKDSKSHNSRHKAPILDDHTKKDSIEFFVCLFRLELILTRKEAVSCFLSQKVWIVTLKTQQKLTVVYEATN